MLILAPIMNYSSFLTTKQTAELLGISIASVSNWVRHGYLTRTAEGFSESEVERLIERIKSGEVERMNSRANKKRADGNIAPGGEFRRLYETVAAAGLGNSASMLLLCARLFIEAGSATEEEVLKLLIPGGVGGNTAGNAEPGDSPALNHLKHWLDRLNPEALPGLPQAFDRLLKTDIPRCSPAEKDIAGVIYQGLKQRGERACSGSFYTPPEIAGGLFTGIIDGKINNTTTFLDPCCGTGQFLFSFIEAGGSPDNVYGIDIDPVAALTATANLILSCPESDCTGRIISADSLIAVPSGFPERFDLIATNPPWGSCGAQRKKELQQKFPHIQSRENFSFFISRALSLVRDGGTVAMVLPESITSVKKHRDIRKHIIKNADVKKIMKHGRPFKHVFTPVITLEMEQKSRLATSSAAGPVAISGGGGTYSIEQSRFSENSDYIFNINIKSEDTKIIDKVYSIPHTTLKNNADWALGIVTGDNRRYLSNELLPCMEPVIRGSDILPGSIKKLSTYIEFTPERFQQTAHVEKYRCHEKLVYKFISKRLVFAVDSGGRLTLNSANILIPRIEGCSAGLVMKLFNSDLYNFIYRKKFNSVKVLRSYLEELPIPLDMIETRKPAADGLTNLFKLTEEEMEYINNYKIDSTP